MYLADNSWEYLSMGHPESQSKTHLLAIKCPPTLRAGPILVHIWSGEVGVCLLVDSIGYFYIGLVLSNALHEPENWVNRSGKKGWTSFQNLYNIGLWAPGYGFYSILRELEFEVENSECKFVSQKQTKSRDSHLPWIIFLFSVYLSNGFIRNLNAIPCFRDVVLYCFLQLSLNELKSLCDWSWSTCLLN